jgi:transposase
VKILRLDHSGAHTAPRVQWPDHVRPVWLPPDGPELNPIERVWRDLKDDLAWQQCSDIEAPQNDVGALWQAYDAPALPSLTGYTYLVDAMHALNA